MIEWPTRIEGMVSQCVTVPLLCSSPERPIGFIVSLLYNQSRDHKVYLHAESSFSCIALM